MPQLSARTIAALWALRVFVVLVSLMVIYTFIDASCTRARAVREPAASSAR